MTPLRRRWRSALYLVVTALTCPTAQAVVVLDTSFGDAGFATVGPDVPGAGWVHVAATSDHGIVATKLISTPEGPGVLLAKLRSSGAIDDAFGDGGTRRIALGGTADAWGLWRLLVLPDGGLFVLAGLARGAGMFDAAALRVDAHGNISSNFNDGEPLTFPLPAGTSAWTALSHGDGFLLATMPTASPYAYYDPAVRSSAHFIRLTSDGRIDAAFGTNGHVEEPEQDGLFGDTMLLPDGGFQVLHAVKRADGRWLNRWHRYRADGGVGGEIDVGDDGRAALVGVFPLESGVAVTNSAPALAGFLDAEGAMTTAAPFPPVLYGTRTVLPFDGSRVLVGYARETGFPEPPPGDGTFAAAVDGQGNPDRTFTAPSSHEMRLNSRLQRYNMAVDSPSTFVVGESMPLGQIRVARYREIRGTGDTRPIPAMSAGGAAALALLLLAATITAGRRDFNRA